MFSDFFNALWDFVLKLPLPPMGDLGGFIVLILVIPIILGLLTSWGDWRSTGIACIIWYGGLGLLALIGRNEEAGFAFIFAFLFSMLAIPVLSLIVKFTRKLLSMTNLVS
ncbi:hypothetical protein [Fretibacter rubidus]|uniref:hypothetical protein n=1 Tax=Fretibacter rubidus TaxID=570162 RepID=UPI00352A6F13